ncbi:MAG: hypothetical protein R3F59_17050 [Myxococcota bacterium]
MRYVAAARFARDGCGARQALEAAVAEVPAAPEGLLLATCLLDEDPARARALLGAADLPETTEQARLAERLRQALEAP